MTTLWELQRCLARIEHAAGAGLLIDQATDDRVRVIATPPFSAHLTPRVCVYSGESLEAALVFAAGAIWAKDALRATQP